MLEASLWMRRSASGPRNFCSDVCIARRQSRSARTRSLIYPVSVQLLAACGLRHAHFGTARPRRPAAPRARSPLVRVSRSQSMPLYELNICRGQDALRTGGAVACLFEVLWWRVNCLSPHETRGTDEAHTHHMAPGAAALGTRHTARIWTPLEVTRIPANSRPTVLDVYIARASHSHRQSIDRRRDETRDQAFLTLIVVAVASPQSASVPLTALPWYINTVGAFAPAATTLVFSVSAVSLGATITSTVSSFDIHGISGSVGYDGGVR